MVIMVIKLVMQPNYFTEEIIAKHIYIYIHILLLKSIHYSLLHPIQIVDTSTMKYIVN